MKRIFIVKWYKRFRYYFKNWKIGIHLIFRTRRFGVNNQRWGTFDSMFGWSWRKRIKCILTVKPMIQNYKHMKLRAGTMCYFLTDEDYEDCFSISREAESQKRRLKNIKKLL